MDPLVHVSEPAMTLLGPAIGGLGLNVRAYDKIRRVSRTVVDLDGKDEIGEAHVETAVQYRLLDRRV
ncbi:MAG: hypothetical protein K8E66_10060 [Phycisphaerales bacterium]|nr:hypothetical protein [Phycisphaerales bacterium]